MNDQPAWDGRVGTAGGSSFGTALSEFAAEREVSHGRLAEATGLHEADVRAGKGILPATRFAVNEYLNIVRNRSLLEAVASSLTELFSRDLIALRMKKMRQHYPWLSGGLDYFQARLTQAPEDAAFATKYVYDASRDEITVTAGTVGTAGGATPEGNARGVSLLLDSRRRLVGVDLRGSAPDCVLMLGQHEDVSETADGHAVVGTDSEGGVSGAIRAASKTVHDAASSPYLR